MTRQKVEQSLKARAVSYDIVLEMDNTELIKQYVEIGMGVAMCSDYTFQPEDHERLGVVRLNHLFPPSVVGVCTLKGRFLGRSVRNFIDTLVEHLRGYQVPQQSWGDVKGEPSQLAVVGSSDN
jgi:DNA-binding transcriptional LysR family regulator